MISDDVRANRLMWWGMTLFLLGLVTGLLQNALTNPRMGLAAHLEGLMNGTFLLVVGAIWSRIRLPPRLLSITYAALVFGAAMNWAITLFAATTGTSSMTPLAGSGHVGARWQEAVVTVGFVRVGIAMLMAVGLAVWGLRRSIGAGGMIIPGEPQRTPPPPPAAASGIPATGA